MLTTRDETYIEALGRYQRARSEEPDRNWRAFLRMLAGSSLWERLEPVVNFKRAEVDFPAAERALVGCSGGERLVYQVARAFYEGVGPVDLCELADRLDPGSWRALMEALTIYRG